MKTKMLSLVVMVTLNYCLVLAQNEKSYDFKGFDEVKVSHPFYVEISQGESFSVKLQAEEKYMEYMSIEMKGEALVVGMTGKKHVLSKIRPM